jgi:hypothetical protein
MAYATISPTASKRNRIKQSCSVEGCERIAESKGMCMKHYSRFKRYGHTNSIWNTGTPVERFHRSYNVNPETGCWEWKAWKSPTGYGIFPMPGNKRIKAHRYSYEMFIGPIPDGMFVLHKCDVRSCCRPDHLFAGSHQENMTDMVKKGRWGDRNRLYPDAVRDIRRTYAEQGTRCLPILAEKYGVAQPAVWAAAKRRSWADVPD